MENNVENNETIDVLREKWNELSFEGKEKLSYWKMVCHLNELLPK